MQIMNISDDGQWIVVDREDGMSPEELTFDEFVEIYGYNPLEEDVEDSEMDKLTPRIMPR